jgi:hypothetical protein
VAEIQTPASERQACFAALFQTLAGLRTTV